MRVNCERTMARVNQGLARIAIWSLRTVANGDAELMIFVLVTDGVVEEKFPIRFRNFRRPKVRAKRDIRTNHGVPRELPLNKIRRLNERENFPNRRPARS